MQGLLEACYNVEKEMVAAGWPESTKKELFEQWIEPLRKVTSPLWQAAVQELVHQLSAESQQAILDS